jgi:hypothetical protein
MSALKNLLKTDLVVRFDPSRRSISFHGVSPVSGTPLATAIHEIAWPQEATLTNVIDVGAGACAHFFACFPEAFCSADDWERIAGEIRVATGRDAEE